jgi:type II secretory pathway component PulM
MFTLTQEMLKILLVLSKDSVWPIFIHEFKKIRDENVDDTIHFFPDLADVNARERQTLLRGIAVCLDVLYNAFLDPVSLLEDVKLVENTNQSQKDSNPF